VLLVDKPVAAKRFYDMMTEFKASDLDYIVFDMPSLGDTSSTLPMAGFMDKVLLVVEAEKSNRNAVKRAYAQLAARADVSVVFNKSRVYGPKWLQGEL
jgi:Mrp family chromosome partitioning ATPase